MVDQSDSEFDVRITRQADGKSTFVPYTYKYDDDPHQKHYYDQFRFFSISLPAGSYQLEFLKDLQPAWPNFVLQRWEGIPKCEGYLLESHVDLVRPYATCDNLIVNGDMEEGAYYWLHGKGGASINDVLLPIKGKGLNDSTALRRGYRSSPYDGVGQNLDTRCLHQSAGEFYEIELYFRLEEQDTSPFICDPFSTSFSTSCPTIFFMQQKYIDAKVRTIYSVDHTSVVIPNNVEDFDLMHGVFKVDEPLLDFERIFMNLGKTRSSLDLIIDHVSVKKLPGVCRGELVRNGGFEENSKYWKINGEALMDIGTSSSNVMKVFNRNSKTDGVVQDFYVDKSCFRRKQRYAFTGKIL